MDLAKLDIKAASEQGAVLELVHPATFGTDAEEPIGVYLTVMGADSQPVRDALADFNKRKSRGQKVSDEEFGLTIAELVIIGWENLALDGEELEFSKQNCRRLLRDPRMEWVVKQIGPFVLDLRNFAQNLPQD